MEEIHVKHPWGPLYDENSEVLILGSFPSPKSRENNFFYGHPQNRFWKVIAALYGEKVPTATEDKKKLILSHGLALWDVIDECDITGASDASVRNAKPTDIKTLTEGSNIKRIYCNGAKSYELYRKFSSEACGIEAVKLPSTSPANAAWSMERLLGEWRRIL